MSSTVPGIGEDLSGVGKSLHCLTARCLMPRCRVTFLISPRLGAITGRADADDGQEFKETVCRWANCNQQFEQHDDLVKVGDSLSISDALLRQGRCSCCILIAI